MTWPDPSPQRRIGIYGGTFDPIHLGHLAIADEARWALGLDRVIFVPAARQPLKPTEQGAPPRQRLTMVDLACQDAPGFLASPIEIERPPPSYSIDTLMALRGSYGPQAELWLIVGADAALDLPRWHRIQDVIGLARLAVVGRPGYQLDLAALDREVPGVAVASSSIPGPQLEISSSDLRRRLAAGQPVRYQLHPAVWRYIIDQGLYRGQPEVPDEHRP